MSLSEKEKYFSNGQLMESFISVLLSFSFSKKNNARFRFCFQSIISRFLTKQMKIGGTIFWLDKILHMYILLRYYCKLLFSNFGQMREDA